jgi:hypothetical protein
MAPTRQIRAGAVVILAHYLNNNNKKKRETERAGSKSGGQFSSNNLKIFLLFCPVSRYTENFLHSITLESVRIIKLTA